MARKTPVEESIERLAEEKIYEKVYGEVASGIKREGLWFKALSESDGEETKAKALYVKYRVHLLIDLLDLKFALILGAAHQQWSGTLIQRS